VQGIKSEAEKKAIATALEKTKWNRKAAARLLKVSYRTLLYKIEQYQMRASDSTLLPGADWPGDAATEVRGDDEMD
jgi:DNA-binding NtrC family response regulator